MGIETRIMIVDDHPLMRQGLAATIESAQNMKVCCQVSSAEEAMDEIAGANPDIVIVDISLPGMGGLELIKHLRNLYPDLKTLVVSRHDEVLYAERAIRAGARGYVMKLEAGEVIVEAIRRVMRGGIFVSEEINERLLMSMASGRPSIAQSPMEILSDRELEVLELFGKGQTTRDIAERLHLSVKTIESYRSRIKEKLHLSSATELMQRAVQWVNSESGDS